MPKPIVVIGAGYAGRIAAVRLARSGVDVTLVDPRAHVFEKVRLHNRAAGQTRTEVPLLDVMASVGATFVQGAAAMLEDGLVTLSDGRTLPAEHIALTVGVRTSRSLDGSEHALTLDGPEDADRLNEHVRKQQQIAIVGSGFTAIELAGALVPHTEVTLVGSGMQRSQALSQAVTALKAQGVTIVDGRVLAISPGAVHLTERTIQTDIMVNCTGTDAPPLARTSGLPVDTSGRAIASRTLAITPWCSGAGDGVVLPDMPWTGLGCAVAMPMGAHLAACVLARLHGKPAPSFHYGWGGRILEAGETAVRQRTLRDGSEQGASTHRGWWWTKQAILSYTSWGPELERRTGLPAIGSLGDPPMSLTLTTAS